MLSVLYIEDVPEPATWSCGFCHRFVHDATPEDHAGDCPVRDARPHPTGVTTAQQAAHVERVVSPAIKSTGRTVTPRFKT
jgi:hypothetical protein